MKDSAVLQSPELYCKVFRPFKQNNVIIAAFFKKMMDISERGRVDRRLGELMLMTQNGYLAGK